MGRGIEGCRGFFGAWRGGVGDEKPRHAGVACRGV